MAQQPAGDSQLAVGGPEVRAPFGNAMSLVDREERRNPELMAQHGGRCGEAFRGEVEQPERACPQCLDHDHPFHRRRGAGEGRRRDAAAPAGRNLVRHQADQGSDDDGDAIEKERGYLKTSRLARAGRKHRQRIPALQDGAYDVALGGPKVGKPEVALQ